MSALWNGLQDLLGGILAFFYDLIPQYGISIILLTVLIGLVLFPLTLKQTRSMKAMQELQPEVKRLQKQHKGDREKLNQEMMALYQERGVNPAAGCLPLLVQLPIWFALFRVLRDPVRIAVDNLEAGAAAVCRVASSVVPESSKLYDKVVNAKLTSLVEANPGIADAASCQHADTGLNFLGLDLLVSPQQAFNEGIIDVIPYVILILIVVATGYYQARQTQARRTVGKESETPQAQQMQTVMKVMPVLFGVFSWVWPTGLVLYFAASQTFRIGQQALILQLDERDEAEKAREEAKKPPPPPPDETGSPPRRPQPGSKKRKRRRK